MIQAVVDVNVLVSAMIGRLGFCRRVIAAWRQGQFDLLMAEGIITELDGKLRLPRISKWLTDYESNRQWIIQPLRTQAKIILVPLHECLSVTGDPEDDYVLAATRLSNAGYLITGDKKLLSLREYSGAKIVSPREFATVLGSQD